MAMTDQLAEQQDLSPQEAQKLVNRFQFLLQINASINSTIDIKVLLRKIIDVAALVMNAEASSLALVDPVSEELIFHLAEGDVDAGLGEFTVDEAVDLIGGRVAVAQITHVDA